MICENDDIILKSFEIMKEVYGNNLCIENYIHKHLENPHKIKKAICLFYDNEKAVGMNAFMGMRLLESGNVHYISQSNDTATLPDYRGREIFTKIVSSQEREDYETEYIIGLPNNNSVNGFIKMGFETVAQLHHLILFSLPALCIVKIKRLFKIKENVNYFSYVNELPFSWEDYKILNDGTDCKFERSEDYYKWKLWNKCFHFVVARNYDSTLQGFVLYHYENKKHIRLAIIDDWFESKASADSASLLGNMISRIPVKHLFYEVPVVNCGAQDYRVLKNLGFVDVCSKPVSFFRGSPLVVSSRGGGCSYLSSIRFKAIDMDTF